MTTDLVLYGAIRKDKDSGQEWIEIGTLSTDRSTSIRIAHRNDMTLPDWAKHNPVVRHASYRIKEID